MVCSASEVLEFGLKAYCEAEMMLWVVQCVMIWSLMILSSIFPMIGSNEIGRYFSGSCRLSFLKTAVIFNASG
jgi:hypothetical protein